MKKPAILCLFAALLLAFTACGDRTRSYSYYEFVCEGNMTVTHGSDASAVLSEEDEAALLGIFGNAWEVGKAPDSFDYAFAWENTTIRYHAGSGVFRLGDTEQILKLSDEERHTVEKIIQRVSE